MITKHFFKTLVIFTGMILLGLVGIFLVSYFGQGEKQLNALNNKTQVAK